MDLFTREAGAVIWFAPHAALLPGFAQSDETGLLDDLHMIIKQATWRHMMTPNGFAMSVATSNCGALGWVSDRAGYRYSAHDPLTDRAWPAMPPSFAALATRAAQCAGFAGFIPDACLINRYEVGARMGLHRDLDERDLGQPIVSVSLGLPAMFQFGGASRQDRVLKVPVHHQDVVVWGGDSRTYFHGVMPIKQGHHALLGAMRINLTFRKAG